MTRTASSSRRSPPSTATPIHATTTNAGPQITSTIDTSRSRRLRPQLATISDQQRDGTDPERHSLPSSRTAATRSGSSHVGRWPQPGRSMLRTPGGIRCSRRTSRSCSGHAERHRHVDRLERREARAAHRRVGGVEPRRQGVRAHEPQRVRRRHVLRPRHGAAERQSPHTRPPQQRRQHREQQPRQRAGGRALGLQRLRPQPRGRDRGHRRRVARGRHLQRHPAAERVARHVRALDPARRQPGRHGRGESGRRRAVDGRRAAESGQVEREHIPRAGQPVEHRIPHVVVGPQRMQEHQGASRPAPRAGDRHFRHTAGAPVRITR